MLSLCMLFLVFEIPLVCGLSTSLSCESRKAVFSEKSKITPEKCCCSGEKNKCPCNLENKKIGNHIDAIVPSSTIRNPFPILMPASWAENTGHLDLEGRVFHIWHDARAPSRALHIINVNFLC